MQRRSVEGETQVALLEQRGARIGCVLPLLVRIPLLAVEDVDVSSVVLIQAHGTVLAMRGGDASVLLSAG